MVLRGARNIIYARPDIPVPSYEIVTCTFEIVTYYSYRSLLLVRGLRSEVKQSFYVAMIIFSLFDISLFPLGVMYVLMY